MYVSAERKFDGSATRRRFGAGNRERLGTRIGKPENERVADAARAARRAAQDASALSAAMAWTPAARRLFSLVESCLAHKEPALLVGETGCGKTSVCQLLALLRGQRLRVLNCHQHTETGDFLGGFRPARAAQRNAEKRDDLDDQGTDVPFAWEDGPLVRAMRDGDILLVDELSLAEDSVLERLNSVLESGRALTLPRRAARRLRRLWRTPTSGSSPP